MQGGLLSYNLVFGYWLPFTLLQRLETGVTSKWSGNLNVPFQTFKGEYSDVLYNVRAKILG